MNHNPLGFVRKDPERLLYEGSPIWVTSRATELKIQILILSHFGSVGNRRKEAAESMIRQNFKWNGMPSDREAFLKGFLHCITTRSEEVMLRPLRFALQG